MRSLKISPGGPGLGGKEPQSKAVHCDLASNISISPNSSVVVVVKQLGVDRISDL